MDRLRMPSDAELMKIAIADLRNSALSTEERQRALQELLILVEPIDNANGLFNYQQVALNPGILCKLLDLGLAWNCRVTKFIGSFNNHIIIEILIMEKICRTI